jgi:hypothetical protein
MPKVFISYSWSNAARVVELAERLRHDGVDVVLDKWELKEGQDKYAFMERSVTDETVSKVLIICDKQYVPKANDRIGGVGDETMIISPEVYAKVDETKYIPIIFERDETGKEYMPTYLKSRIYIDLSNDELYEENYDQLLRNLHNKPVYSKPALGKMPEYLNDEGVSLSKLRTAVRQIEAYDGKNQTKVKIIICNFNIAFTSTLLELVPLQGEDFDQQLLRQIDAAKPLRDLFLDYVEALITCDLDVGDILGNFFEQLYNGVYHIECRDRYEDSEFEFSFFMIWEMFICSTAILLHYENYQNLHNLLNRTYFLRERPTDEDMRPDTYVRFRSYSRYIEGPIKEKSENPRRFTLAGDIVTKREKKPIITKSALSIADVILYQLSCVYDFISASSRGAWFPMLYPYLGSSYYTQMIWRKMVSLKHCQKLFPLFGVTDLTQLVTQITKNKPDHGIRYSGALDRAPVILDSITVEKVGSMP